MTSYDGHDSFAGCEQGTDEYNCRLLEVFQPLIMEKMKATHVMPELTSFITRESMTKIRKADRLEGDKAAAQLLIDELMAQKNPGWFRGFLDALRNTDFETLANHIEGLPTISIWRRQKFIDIMHFPVFPRLINEVNPKDIMIELRMNKTISHRDYEEISARMKTDGDMAGMEILLERILKHSDTWLADFVNALRNCKTGNYNDIVDNIEPKLNKVCQEDVPKVAANFMALNREPENYIDTETSETKRNICKVSPSMSGRQAHDVMDVDEQQMSIHFDSQPTIDTPLMAENVAASQERTTPEGQEVSPLASMDYVSADDRPGQTNTPTGSHVMSLDSNVQSYETAVSVLPPSDHTQTIAKTRDTNRTNPMLEAMADPDSMNNLATSAQYAKPQIPEKILNIPSSGAGSMVSNLDTTLPNIDEPMDHSSQGAEAAEGQSGAVPPPEVTPENLELRPYQTELARKAIRGQNVIIVAPTGSGKTHVALAISKSHLEARRANEEGAKVVFIVPTVELVTQQWKLYRKYLSDFSSYGMSGDLQDSQKVPLGELVLKYDIILMTPQILVDALAHGTLDSIGELTLMIFDECHHATKAHPYNMIMRFYLQEKLAAPDERMVFYLPQIVGLTASVGVGKARDMIKAQNYILSLCAYLDCEDICTVEETKAELNKHVNNPDERKEETQGRRQDPFSDIINEIMSRIEELLKRSTVGMPEAASFERLVVAPSTRGCDPYTQWISRLEKPIARIHNQQLRRPLKACIDQLKVYNNALRINADCRTKDAVDFLEKELKEIHIPYKDTTDLYLEKLLTAQKERLTGISQDPRYHNPKLDRLGHIILEHEASSPDMRVIIFCKTRALTVALQNWMKGTRTLAHLNPSRVTGGASTERGGMTLNQQEDVLTYFKEGTHKVIVATSVAEEGLDVSKCDLVVRYEYVTNEIAMIQARGRSRAEDSKYVVLSERGRGLTEKEDLNKIREIMMGKTIKKLKELSEDERKQRIHKLQIDAKHEWAMEEAGRRAKELSKTRHRQSTWELRCLKCDQLGCLSSDIRKVEPSHHFVIDDTFHERIKTEHHPDPKKYGDFQKTDKIFCNKCYADWGIKAIYKGTKFPVIKVVSFIVIDTQTNQRDTCKKWKDVPFPVKPLTPEELQSYAAYTHELQPE